MPQIKTLLRNLTNSHPLYKNSSETDKFELSKLYIRKHLCSRCRDKLFDKSRNDFWSLDTYPCPACVRHIERGLDNAINKKAPLYIIERNKEIRRRLLVEIKAKTGTNAYDLLNKIHNVKLMTAPAICEYLYDKFQITIPHRHLTLIMRDWGILNSNVVALRKRVITGRMNYKKRKIDYENRIIDYKLRERRKREGIEAERKVLVVRANDDLRRTIRSLCKKHKKTISQTVRILLDAISADKLPASCKTYADKLRYAIKHKERFLYFKDFEKIHGIPVILTGTS